MVKAILSTLEHLKGQPVVLALVLINLLFLAWGVYMFSKFTEAAIRRDAMITTLIASCGKN